MARRDVDLIIRARDEASKAVDAISTALLTLSGNTDTVEKSGERVDSTLSRLGAAVRQLDKDFKGASGAQKFNQVFQQAKSSLDRIRQAIQETKDDLAQYSRASAAAAVEVAKLDAQADEAANALNRETAALERSKTALNSSKAALKEATASRRNLAAADERLTQQTARQSERVEETRARYQALSSQLQQTLNPTQTLKNKVDSTSQSLAKQETRLSELQQSYRETQVSIQATDQLIATLEGRLNESNAAYDRQSDAVRAAAEQQKLIAEQTNIATRNQRNLEESARRAAASLEKQEGDFRRGKEALASLGDEVQDAIGQFNRLEEAAGAELRVALSQQKRSVLEAKQAWQEQEEVLRRLGPAYRQVENPSAALTQRFLNQVQAARAAKSEFIEQRTGLEQLTRIYNRSASDIDGLRSKQQAFAETQNTVANSVNRIRAEASQSSTSINRLGQSATRASVEVASVGRSATSTAGAMQAGTRNTITFSQALRRLYGEGRQSLSFFQRLRGEVLSLIASYAGFFAITRTIGQVVNAYQQLEAAQSRLNVVFRGDQKAAAQELDFLRRTANRLGQDLSGLANEYSKFAVATQGTNLEGEQTRRIFVAVAEAARVNKNTTEEVNGVFKALTQIISKGKVQAEELRQQLGDRLPGALQLFADGLGVSTEELNRMLEAGEVSSDALVGFADALNRKYSSQLPAALRTTSAELGRLRNNAFQALLTIGNSGLIEKATALFRELNDELTSAEGQKTLESLGKVLGFVVDIVRAAVANFRLLTLAVTAFAGVKIAGLFIGVRNSIIAMNTALFSTRGLVTQVRLGFRQVQGQAIATGGAIRALTISLRALVSSTGIGLAVTAVSILIGQIAISADKASEALIEHRKRVDELKDAYERSGGASEEFRKAFDNLSETEATVALQAAQKELDNTEKKLDRLVKSLFGQGTGFAKEFQALREEFASGSLTVDQFIDKLDELRNQSDGAVSAKFVARVIEAARNYDEAKNSVEEHTQTLEIAQGTVEQAATKLAELTTETDANGESFIRASERAQKFKTAMEELQKIADKVNTEFEDLSVTEEAERAALAAVAAATNIKDRIRAETLLAQIIQKRNLIEQREAREKADKEKERDLERLRESQERFNESLEERIALQRFEIENAQREGLDAKIQEALFKARSEARQAETVLTKEQEQAIIDVTTAEYRLIEAKERREKAEENASKAEREVNNLLATRTALQEQLELLQQRGGNAEAVVNTKAAIEGINEQLQGAIANAVAMYEALGGSESSAAIARLQTLLISLEEAPRRIFLEWEKLNDLFANGLTGAFDSFAESVSKGVKIGEAARVAFLEFASDFLRQIARMILQQAILNALRGLGVPGSGGFSIGAGVFHGGGRPGSPNRRRQIDPGFFANAQRYHEGGVPGLKPGEVPAILRQEEEVLTRNDPRHILNGGARGEASGGRSGDLKIVNAIDAAGFLQAALESSQGEEVIYNFIRARPEAFKQALNG